MFTFTRRLLAYFSTASSMSFEKNAKVEVQLQQSIELARERHAALQDQAATVVGMRHSSEMQRDQRIKDVAGIEAAIQNALKLAKKGGKDAEAHEQTALVLAGRLITAEESLAAAEQTLLAATASAEGVTASLADSTAGLEDLNNQRQRILLRLEQTKMQERVNAVTHGVDGSDVVESLGSISSKVDARYAKALGVAEVQSGSVRSQVVRVERLTNQARAAERLELIRSGDKPRAITSA